MQQRHPLSKGSQENAGHRLVEDSSTFERCSMRLAVCVAGTEKGSVSMLFNEVVLPQTVQNTAFLPKDEKGSSVVFLGYGSRSV